MKKKVISLVAAAALMLSMGAAAVAAEKVSSITGGIEASTEASGTTIDTTVGAKTDASGEIVDIDTVQTPVVQIVGVSQAQSAGEAASGTGLTSSGLTAEENAALVAEYNKTKDAANGQQALEILGATEVVQQATGISGEKLANCAEVQIMKVNFNTAANAVAQQAGGVTLTMQIAGTNANSTGFVLYYDAQGNVKAVPFKMVVGSDGVARVSFKLPNASTIRIYVTASV